MENEVKEAAKQHVEKVGGNNACYDSFISGVTWLMDKDTNDDFIRIDDIFVVGDEAYSCTGVIHDDKRIFGRCLTSFESWPKEKEFHFDEVYERYFKK